MTPHGSMSMLASWPVGQIIGWLAGCSAAGMGITSMRVSVRWDNEMASKLGISLEGKPWGVML